MKTKKNLIWAFIAMAGMIGFISCSDDDDLGTEDKEVITETEAVEFVAYSVASGTDGLTADIKTTAELSGQLVENNGLKSTSNKTLSCGESRDTTFISKSTSLITFESTRMYDYRLECDQSGNPLMLDFSFTYEGEFDAPRIASQHSGNGDFTVTNIEHTSDMYLINGIWQRNSSFESKIRNQGTRQASLQFELIDVAVEKEPKEVDNGTIIFSLEGERVSGSSNAGYKYEGTITYNGNGEAIIEITGSNSSYITNLETGEVEKL